MMCLLCRMSIRQQLTFAFLDMLTTVAALHAPASPASLPPWLDESHQQGAQRCAFYVRRELLQAEVHMADLLSGAIKSCAFPVRVGGPDITVASIYVCPDRPASLMLLAQRLGKDSSCEGMSVPSTPLRQAVAAAHAARDCGT
ncbi:hypothetical protein MTO96_042075 [Rhipicephalus appendiculatus]